MKLIDDALLRFSIQCGKAGNLLSKEISLMSLPYGSTDFNSIYVFPNRKEENEISVVIGLQYISDYYNTNELIGNFKGYFEKSIEIYNKKNFKNKIDLYFEKLSGEYGKPLQKSIKEKITSSDIAIFEISDQNPNVMMEYGIAIGKNVCTLLIREKNSPKPTSNIRETWVDYVKSGEIIFDEDFNEKLEKMIIRVIDRKFIILE
jgi:hypothetical protein